MWMQVLQPNPPNDAHEVHATFYQSPLLSLAGGLRLSAATSELWGKAGERWTLASPMPDFNYNQSQMQDV
jgi:hypothetical protein